MIATVFTSVRAIIPAAILPSHGLPAGNVLRAAMFVLTIGTLVMVLIAVELLRLWVHRSARREAQGAPSGLPPSLLRVERRAQVRLESPGGTTHQEAEWLLPQAQEH